MNMLFVLACSGPGASDAMASASLIGLACLAVSFAATITSVVRARKVQLRLVKTAAVVAVILLLVHPTVWLGVSSGDCGNALRMVGPVFAALHLGILGFVLLRRVVS